MECFKSIIHHISWILHPVTFIFFPKWRHFWAVFNMTSKTASLSDLMDWWQISLRVYKNSCHTMTNAWTCLGTIKKNSLINIDIYTCTMSETYAFYYWKIKMVLTFWTTFVSDQNIIKTTILLSHFIFITLLCKFILEHVLFHIHYIYL